MIIPINQLAEHFAQEQVKQRRGSFGQQLAYVEASTVVQRLNEALEGDWSFHIVETQFEQEEVIVRGRLTINGTVREQFGGSRITRNKDTGEMISLADDLKAASSDALKKCATLTGVGLHLYQDKQPANGNSHSSGNGYNRPNGNNGNYDRNQRQNRVTNDQITRIFQAAKDIGVPQAKVIQLSRDNFNANITQLTPQQAEDLITIIGSAA